MAPAVRVQTGHQVAASPGDTDVGAWPRAVAQPSAPRNSAGLASWSLSTTPSHSYKPCTGAGTWASQRWAWRPETPRASAEERWAPTTRMEPDAEPAAPQAKGLRSSGRPSGSCERPTKICGTDVFLGTVPMSVSVASRTVSAIRP